MQRVIKFRGKRVDGNQEWIYGSYVIADPDSKYGDPEHRIVAYAQGVMDFNYRVDGETVGQFCGLPDINGKDAYFGDIVKYRDQSGTEQIGVIQDYDYFQGYLEAWNGDEEGNQDGELHPSEPFEIIGNIHEHKHLLTEAV